MPLLAFRWQNFRSFRDTGWIEVSPITLLLGANASGKTSLIAPLLLLRQTNDSRDTTLALKTKGVLFNAGSFNDFVHGHDRKLPVIFELRFRSEADPGAFAERPVPSAPPGQLSLEYGENPEDGTPVLIRFTVYDSIGREMLSRTRMADGTYDLTGVDLPRKGASAIWTEAILATRPEGFLFTPQNIFLEYYERASTRRDSEPAGESANVPMAREHSLYFSTMAVVTSEMNELLGNTTYIGPLRERPKRIYEVGGETPFSVGSGGQYAPEILFRNCGSDLEAKVNEWIERFQFGRRIECKRLAPGVFSLFLHRGGSGARVNAADTGFGLSQVLPLIIQGFYGDAETVLVAEQPEIHLNPRLQSVLADLFASVSDRHVRVLAETHSEHLVLRLRRLIAEQVIEASDLALYFTERKGNTSAVRRIAVDDVGHIASEEWPRGFFEETLSESLGLATAQARLAPRDR